MSDYTKQYPNNVIPQLRSPKPSEPLPCLTCPPNDELQAIIIESSNLSVIRGWEWRSNIDMKEFFHPCDNYAEYQVVLPAGNTMSLSYGPIGTSTGNSTGNPTGSVNFVMLFPQYHQTNIDLQSDWKMKWKASGSTAWQGLGRILMLSGTEDFSIPPLDIENTSPADVEIKILVAI